MAEDRRDVDDQAKAPDPGSSFDSAIEDLAKGPASIDPEHASGGEEAADETHPTIAPLREQFGPAVLRHEVMVGDEHVVFVAPERCFEVLRWLRDDPAQRFDLLKDVTAVDYGGERPLQVVYELWSIPQRRQLRLKAELPLDALEIDSAVPLWETANWLEREVYDLFGITFKGHPDLRRIMMPEHYAEGHPLRKDFPLRGRFSRAEQTRRALSLDVEDHYIPEEIRVGGEAGGTDSQAQAHAQAQASPAGPDAASTDRDRALQATAAAHTAQPAEASPAPAAVAGPSAPSRDSNYLIRRDLELGPDGRPAPSPVLPPGVEPELQGERMLINIGPQHPATHGVLRLVLELDGETVVRCIPHIGYLHSSFEKIGEYRTWNQIIPLTDRMDYLAPLIYNVAYAAAVEKLMGIEITERCKVVRVICMELDRIFSHLLWIGTTGIDIGAFTIFLWTFQERERIYELHEKLTGARITTSATRIGGMMSDLPEGWIEELQHFVDTLPKTLDEVETMLTSNNIWIGRNRDVGVFSAEEAISQGLTGPNLRASGVDYDVRKDRPYYDYETYDFDVVCAEAGDCYDRYLVRMEEMRQSLRILQQAIDRLPGGPINVDDPRVILPSKTDAMTDMASMIHHFKVVMEGVPAPPGESWFSVESSKGELGMYVVSDGGSKPVRWRVRGPSFVNLSALPKMVQGHLLTDVITVNASLDIVLGEIDR